ncbi:MAG: phage major capsid protein [Pseudohongiella sp.]|nr:phage major capsid protein [Pseudohongiella sp.]
MPENAYEQNMAFVAKQYQAVQNNLSEVDANLRDFAKSREQKDFELQARIMEVEQKLIAGAGQSFHSVERPYNPLNDLLKEAEDDYGFSNLKKFSPNSSFKLPVNSSIRAILTTDGWGDSNATSVPSQPQRVGVVGTPEAPLRLIDALPAQPVTSDSIEYVKMTSSGEAGEQVKHGDEKAEVEFSGELERSDIATIAAHTTASKQVLDDNGNLANEIARMLNYKLAARVEHQLINGDGTPGKIKGLLLQAYHYIFSASPLSPADKIGAALTAMEMEGYQPSIVLMNPIDWFTIQTQKDLQEQYLFGSPTSPQPPSIWTRRVVTSNSVPNGTVLCLDTNYIKLLDRERASVSMTNSYMDYFTRNLVKILGELRLGLAVYDEKACYRFSIADSSE